MVIPLTQGKFTEINAKDWPLVRSFKWCAQKDDHTFYAVAMTPMRNGKRRSLKMHRVILGLSGPKPHVDHRDGNGLNNKRKNLRVCLKGYQNLANSKVPKSNTSGFKGVIYDKRTTKRHWKAKIQTTHLGHFESKIEAARAYDRVALARFGEFARLNFP